MEDFVSFEIAKKLKEKGFQEECLCHYVDVDLVYNIESPIANNQLLFCHNKYDNIWHRDNYDAPTISQVLKWLRKEKKMHIIVEISDSGWYYTIYPSIRWENGILKSDKYIMSFKNKDSYEAAALSGIEYVLNNFI